MEAHSYNFHVKTIRTHLCICGSDTCSKNIFHLCTKISSCPSVNSPSYSLILIISSSSSSSFALALAVALPILLIFIHSISDWLQLFVFLSSVVQNIFRKRIASFEKSRKMKTWEKRIRKLMRANVMCSWNAIK